MEKEVTFGQFLALALVIGVFSAMLTLGVFGKQFTGMAQAGEGEVLVGVKAFLGIIIDPDHNKIDFGDLGWGEERDTVSGSPFNIDPQAMKPFMLENTGSAIVDVLTCAKAGLWSGPNAAQGKFHLSVANTDGTRNILNCVDVNGKNACFKDIGSMLSPKPLPTGLDPATGVCLAPTEAVNDLNWQATRDKALVHIMVKVPAEEAPGARSTLVRFEAVAANTIP